MTMTVLDSNPFSSVESWAKSFHEKAGEYGEASTHYPKRQSTVGYHHESSVAICPIESNVARCYGLGVC
jgi:hypothetical protein